MSSTVKHIVVTQLDIDKGRKGSGNRCPVARAMHRVGMRGVWVSQVDVQVSEWMYLPFNQRVGRWIQKFDEGHKVKPMEFSLRFPAKEER